MRMSLVQILSVRRGRPAPLPGTRSKRCAKRRRSLIDEFFFGIDYTYDRREFVHHTRPACMIHRCIRCLQSGDIFISRVALYGANHCGLGLHRYRRDFETQPWRRQFWLRG